MSSNLTRRGFGKLVSALAMVPTVELRKHVDHERLLSEFCDKGEFFRFGINAPFGVGSLTYATDAKHIARCELAGRVENGERRLPRNVGEVWDKFYTFDEWKAIPFEMPDIRSCRLRKNYDDRGTCPKCGGRRISYGESYPTNEWASSGLAFVCDYDVDTNTVLDESCTTCKGRRYNGPWIVDVCGVPMSYSRLRPIAALPCVRVMASERKGALIFAAEGFEGIALGIMEDER